MLLDAGMATTMGSPQILDGGVVITYGGRDLHLHPLWLRERSRSVAVVDPVNGQRLVEPNDLPLDLAVVDVGVSCRRGLELTFSDGHQMALPLTSLVDTGSEDPPTPRPWRAADTAVPVIDHRELVGSDARAATAAMRRALTAFFELGFFVLEATPAEPGALYEITKPFGRISSTNFGSLFDVRSVPAPVDLAYASVGLSAHTDQPYRAPTPGLQFLHTIVNDAPGGASTMVDGLAAVAELAHADPEAFEVLSSLPVEFRYDIGSDVKVHRAPIIEVNDDGSLRQLRFSPRLDFAPLVDRRTLDAHYRGRRWLADFLNEPSRQIEFEMTAGDTLVVDNHRVLHGRTPFDPTRGHRHLQGCYIDHDGPITAWILATREACNDEPSE